MGFFGTTKEVIPETPLDLEAMALEAEIALREANPDLMQKFDDELARQRDGFSFSFKRHGDFLTVFLTRNGNQEHGRDGCRKTYSEAINLGLVQSIRLHDGSPVTSGGEFGWNWQSVGYDENGKAISWGSGSGHPTSHPKNGRIEMVPMGHPTWVPTSRGFVLDGSYHQPSRGMICRLGHESIWRITVDFPKASVDDVIYFVGTNIALTAPFGMGQPMLDALLDEIAANAPTLAQIITA